MKGKEIGSASEVLEEAFIEKSAVKYLERYYGKKGATDKIATRRQQATRNGKVADGLIVFLRRRRPERFFVASLEAKSRKTLYQSLTEITDKNKLRNESWFFSIVTIVIIFSVLWINNIRWVLEPLWIVAIGIFLLAGAYLWMRKFGLAKLNRYKTLGVLEQLKQYPADERWIAIGNDSLTKNDQMDVLTRNCKRAGVGLLVIWPTGNAHVVIHPRFKNISHIRDFLKEYVKKQEIIREIYSGRPVTCLPYFSMTIAQRRYYRNLFLLAVSFLFSLSYITGNVEKAPWKYSSRKHIVNSGMPEKNKRKAEPAVERSMERMEFVNPQPNQAVPCMDKIEGRQYVVVDQFYAEREKAEQRVAFLRSKGFVHADFLWLPCYRSDAQRQAFCVYAYNPRSSFEKASNNLRRYKGKAEIEGMIIKDPFILELENSD